MRQLLLAALGAAGSLLIDLPVLAQLSNTISTFSGQVAATCSLNLPENIELTYQNSTNTLNVLEEFEVAANISPVRIHASRVVVISEPLPYASAITPYVYIYNNEGDVVMAGKSWEDIQGTSFNFSTTGVNALYLNFQVFTEARGDDLKYELPSGSYSYRTTISCLQ